MKNNYRIGEFSKLAKLTVKTLRYYDEVGLLKPDYIDPDTSYRYYQSEQLIAAQKITELRQLGISIDEIVFIQGGGDMVKILTQRKAQLHRELEETQRTCSKIDLLLHQLYDGTAISNKIENHCLRCLSPSSIRQTHSGYSTGGRIRRISRRSSRI